jgi:hypothetical protein
MQRLTLLIITWLVIPMKAFAAPVDPGKAACELAGNTPTGCAGPGILDPGGAFGNVVGFVVFLLGAASVLMIIIGGLRYVLSGGDAAGVKSAKDTILYAVIGLVISTLAYAIVQFVVGRLG